VTVRTIRVFGDPVLRTQATAVDDFDASLRRLVGDLGETLVDAGGAGLAAPQIGVSLRVFVFVDSDPESPAFGEVRHLVNPELRDVSQETVLDEEGCLSIPGLYYELARPQRLVARGFDAHGEPLAIAGSDHLARALAHETDHLDGVLFIDRLPPDERKRALREIREMQMAGEDIVVKHSPHRGVIG
jgi:peptide deformylase